MATVTTTRRSKRQTIGSDLASETDRVHAAIGPDKTERFWAIGLH